MPLAEFAINNAYQASICNTVFFLNYGEHPRTPANLAVPEISGNSNDLATVIRRSLALAQRCLKTAQQNMVKYADRKWREVGYQVGDFVLLSAAHLAHLKFEGSKKLMSKCFGPFEIIKRVGQVAYELKLPSSMRMHDVFHVSVLKLYKRGRAESQFHHLHCYLQEVLSLKLRRL